MRVTIDGGAMDSVFGAMRKAYADGREAAEREHRAGSACFIAICGVISPTSRAADDERRQAVMNAHAAGYNERLCRLRGEPPDDEGPAADFQFLREAYKDLGAVER